MKILAIETSCDETSIAILEKVAFSKYKVLAHETISQINLHREFGGVFPTLSRREHEKNLIPILEKCLEKADLLNLNKELKLEINSESEEFVNKMLNRYENLKSDFYNFFQKYNIKEIDSVAVTNGPGLPPALWVGVNFAKALVKILEFKNNKSIPIYPINHMEGHIVAAISKKQENNIEENIIEINQLDFPVLALLISGGHTELVISNELGNYKKIGETQDDAVGECFDKVARMLQLPYPGGPEISRLAKIGREQNIKYDFKFPRPMIHSKDLNFSFSGLKTHILYFLRDLNVELNENLKIQIAMEFEEAVKDIFLKKVEDAILETGAKAFIVGGGVACNDYLRESFFRLAEKLNIEIFISDKNLSTDNALMIALTAALQIENKKSPSPDFIAIGSKNYNWN